ncbi:MAG: molecular chaperone HtpG [Oscillospiraceae bacterium]|nr:molecular chaperone HtpG [Oscillospiraceae bacterium]
MAKKQFKTDSKRILDLMINSVYTHHEIFLRELISNASDAIDKLYYRSISDNTVGLGRQDYQILLKTDNKARTLTISDNGCGMNGDELEENLGVVAHSDTLRFRDEKGDTPDIEAIGRFGVGFYSSFMVAGKVEVVSRPFGKDESYIWSSEGPGGYTIGKAGKESHGTDIILYLKQDTEDENYGKYLDQYTIRQLVGKYSDYIRYPIKMDIETQTLKEGSEDEYETISERKTLNSMVPIWRRKKDELSDDEYHSFYKSKFMDYQAPITVIHYSVEGSLSYNALLYIPSSLPPNYYSKDFEKGLQLYASGVLISEKCPELLPDYFSFARGLVDSQDISLNISREMIQHDRQLKTMGKNIAKKIKSELTRLLESDREAYEKFYKEFGVQLKYGLYSSYGANRDELQDLVLFKSIVQDKNITLKEYVDNMPEGQKYIYYVCADTAAKAAMMPQTERVRQKGYDILCLTDDVDEFAIKSLMKYQDKEFLSVSGQELDMDDAEKEEADKLNKENKELLDYMSECLGDKVESVAVSSRLEHHPVCLSTEGDISLEMEKILSAMPTSNLGGLKAKRKLEINHKHPVFKALSSLAETDKSRLKTYTSLLYTQALLVEGLPIEDPVDFSNKVCGMMAELGA